MALVKRARVRAGYTLSPVAHLGKLRPRMIRRLFLGAALALAVPCAAGAQEPAPPGTPPSAGDDAATDKKARAKERFLRGVQLAESESWDAALAEFLASRELLPTKVAVENAATSLLQLKRWPEALGMYEELLRDHGATLAPAERTKIEQALAQLRTNVGELEVTAAAGSVVVVDGRQRGQVPLAPIRVGSGTHTLRISRDGFETVEVSVIVAGGQKKKVVAEQRALTRIGTLVVSEASGKTLTVLVDGAAVGKTPWSGSVAAGSHSVALQGVGDEGTPPSAAHVRFGQATSLTLRARRLDAAIRVEPTPSSAHVFVDGVDVGAGVWGGRLPSGVHVLELAEQGFLPYRERIEVKAGRERVFSVALQRDLSSPLWQTGFVPHAYVEAVGGPAFAPSFGGGMDAACGDGSCSERSRPFGLLAGARGGFAFTPELGVELFLGYLSLRASATRELSAEGEKARYASSDYRDETRMSGIVAAASASYRMFPKTPLTFRMWAGVARVRARFDNRGTFRGDVPNPANASDVYGVSESTSVPEESRDLFMPLVGPEVRFGYRLSRRLSLDLGVGVFALLAPSAPRTGTNNLGSGDGDRTALLSDVPAGYADGSDVRPGRLFLPDENGFDTFVAVVPTLAVRFDF